MALLKSLDAHGLWTSIELLQLRGAAASRAAAFSAPDVPLAAAKAHSLQLVVRDVVQAMQFSHGHEGG